MLKRAHRFTLLPAVLAASFAVLLPPAQAQEIAYPSEASRALAECISQSTTTEDRALTARWMAAGIGTAKIMEGTVTVDPAGKLEADKAMGALFTRLFTKDCRAQSAVMMRNGDQEGFTAAGGKLGQIAIAQLMADPEVSQSLFAYIQYADIAAIGQLALE